jgi:hypothetical protein
MYKYKYKYKYHNGQKSDDDNIQVVESYRCGLEKDPIGICQDGNYIEVVNDFTPRGSKDIPPNIRFLVNYTFCNKPFLQTSEEISHRKKLRMEIDPFASNIEVQIQFEQNSKWRESKCEPIKVSSLPITIRVVGVLGEERCILTGFQTPGL